MGTLDTKKSSKITQRDFSNNYCPTSSLVTTKSTTQLRKKDSKVVLKTIWNTGQLALFVSQLHMLMVSQIRQLQGATRREHLHLSLGVLFTAILPLTAFY